MQSPPVGRKPVQVHVSIDTSSRSTPTAGVDVNTLAAGNSGSTVQAVLNMHSGQHGAFVKAPQIPTTAAYFNEIEASMPTNALIQRAIEHEVQRGGQVFVVVPFIRDVGDTKERIRQLLPHIRVLEAHGEHDDLEQRVESFFNREVGKLFLSRVLFCPVYNCVL